MRLYLLNENNNSIISFESDDLIVPSGASSLNRQMIPPSSVLNVSVLSTIGFLVLSYSTNQTAGQTETRNTSIDFLGPRPSDYHFEYAKTG